MYKKYIKRIIDLVVSIPLFIIILPIMLIIALLIKLDDAGPVFFVQPRVGRNRKVFNIIKFRTMVLNAEKNGDGLFVFSEKDNRITKVGNFLRATSLDELPQIINVIKGDMSIIGPRPPVCYHPFKIDDYPDAFVKRFEVLPGITGLAQTKLRNSAPWKDRMVIDVDYVNSLNFIMDICILFQTVISVIKRENVVISEEHKKELEKSVNNNGME